MNKQHYSEGIEVLGAVSDAFATVLTPAALDFVATLHRAFDARRQELLGRREVRQAELVAGKLPGFLPETAAISRRRLASCADSVRSYGSAGRDHWPG